MDRLILMVVTFFVLRIKGPCKVTMVGCVSRAIELLAVASLLLLKSSWRLGQERLFRQLNAKHRDS